MTLEHFTTDDGCRLVYEIDGTGPPVLWQHGLGAPLEQPRQVFPEAAVTRITLACRGHDDSDLGPPDDLSIATFTRDALALLDHLGVETLALAGGISLGAAISLRLAAYRPDRVERLILARPAWLDGPALEEQHGYVEAGVHLERYGADEGRLRFRSTETFRTIDAASPDNARSLLSYFSRPRPETTIALLSRLPKDWPGVPRTIIETIDQPTLVIGNGEDRVHPLAWARELADVLPNAKLQTITSKSVDPDAYRTEFQTAIAHFLTEVAG